MLHLYNEKRQKEFVKNTIFSGVSDINYKILLHMDIKELSKYCRLNTAV